MLKKNTVGDEHSHTSTHLSGEAGDEASAVDAKYLPTPVLFTWPPGIFLFPTFTLKVKRKKGGSLVLQWQKKKNWQKLQSRVQEIE